MAEAKSEGSGTSLGVQWLRLHASNAETMASIPDWGTKIPHAVWPKKKSKEMKISHLEGSKGGMALLSGTRLVVLSPIAKSTSPMFPIPLSGTTTHTGNLIIGLLPPSSHPIQSIGSDHFPNSFLLLLVWASQVALVVKGPPASTGEAIQSWVRKVLWRRKWQPTPVFLPRKSMDRGAWWATVHSIAKSWTQLKQLST